MTIAAPVGTDDFASAPAFPLGGVTPAMDLSTFTPEPDESYFWTAWWTFTPTEDGPVVFDTFLSPDTTGTDTVLDVYSGTEETNLVSLGSNDNVSLRSDYLSVLMVDLTAGQTYYVRLGCWDYGAPTAAVLRVRPAEWQPWVERPPWSGTLDFTPAGSTQVLPDGSGSVTVHMVSSQRDVTDSYKDGTDRRQDVWDRLRGVTHADDGYLLLLNRQDPDGAPEWTLFGYIAGSYQGDDGLFHPSGMEVFERLLHPLFYFSADSEVPLGDNEVAYENEGEPVWSVDLSLSVSGPQQPDYVDPSFEAARAESWRLHAHSDTPWQRVSSDPAQATWPADHLDSGDGMTLHLDETGWFTSQQTTIFPLSLYNPALPSVSAQKTYLYARNITVHATVVVDKPRYRVARALEVPDVPPVVWPPINITPALSGNLKDIDRQFRSA